MVETTADKSHQTGEQPSLRRVMGPGLLLLFVVGDILGTGIYALTGQIASSTAFPPSCWRSASGCGC